MYEHYWELDEKPFKNTMSPRFFYFSQEHEEALVRMVFNVTDFKGLMFLTGSSGVGKTYVSRLFATQMAEKGFTVATITNPNLDETQMLQEILYQFEVFEQHDNKVRLLHELKSFLFGLSDAGGHAILIIDEAHLISHRKTFEELRLLLNIETDERPLISLIFIAQAGLWSKVRTIPQLLQRIGVAYHIEPFDIEETKQYIQHRLQVVNAKREIFSDAATEAIYHHARGITREINNICDLALLIGSGMSAQQIDADIIHECIREMHGKAQESKFLEDLGSNE